MTRKSQISVFIIIVAILILFLAFAFLMDNNVTIKDDSDAFVGTAVSASSLYGYMEECIKSNSVNVFSDFGKQGGIVDVESPVLIYTFNNESIKVSILYYEGDVYLPKLKVWENRISEGIAKRITSCIESEELGMYFTEHSDPSVFVRAEESKTYVKVDWPIIMMKGNISTSLNPEYEYSYDINLINIYDDVMALVAMQYYSPYTLDINLLVELNTSLKSNAIDDVLVYTIYEPGSNIEGIPYGFNFATKANHTWVFDNESI